MPNIITASLLLILTKVYSRVNIHHLLLIVLINIKLVFALHVLQVNSLAL
jgi:hypothetical protein